MKLIIIRLKASCVALLRLGLSTLRLNRLSSSEASGCLSMITSFKFIKKNIIKLPYHRGLTIRGVSFNHERCKSPDGFIRALEAEDDSINEDKFYSVLSSVYAEEQGLMISDFHNGIKDSNLRAKPIETFAYPWESNSIIKKEHSYKSELIQNRSCYKPNLSNDVYDISHIDSHFIQFSTLYKSIMQHGFLSNNNPPKVFILVKDKEWKWIMSGDGNHRAYCNHLLGSQDLLVTIQGVIDRNNIFIQSKRNGHKYSKSELDDLFDILWSGQYCVRGIL